MLSTQPASASRFTRSASTGTATIAPRYTTHSVGTPPIGFFSASAEGGAPASAGSGPRLSAISATAAAARSAMPTGALTTSMTVSDMPDHSIVPAAPSAPRPISAWVTRVGATKTASPTSIPMVARPKP